MLAFPVEAAYFGNKLHKPKPITRLNFLSVYQDSSDNSVYQDSSDNSVYQDSKTF